MFQFVICLQNVITDVINFLIFIIPKLRFLCNERRYYKAKKENFKVNFFLIWNNTHSTENFPQSFT